MKKKNIQIQITLLNVVLWSESTVCADPPIPISRIPRPAKPERLNEKIWCSDVPENRSSIWWQGADTNPNNPKSRIRISKNSWAKKVMKGNFVFSSPRNVKGSVNISKIRTHIFGMPVWRLLYRPNKIIEMKLLFDLDVVNR